RPIYYLFPNNGMETFITAEKTTIAEFNYFNRKCIIILVDAERHSFRGPPTERMRVSSLHRDESNPVQMRATENASRDEGQADFNLTFRTYKVPLFDAMYKVRGGLHQPKKTPSMYSSSTYIGQEDLQSVYEY